MQISEFADDIVNDVSGGNKQFGVILLMIIGAVISGIVQWFFDRYVPKEKAAKDFLNYYNNMGPLRRLKLNWDIYWEMKKHPATGVSSDKLAGAMVNRFKKLTVEDVIALAEKK